jgi:hypothetical protein
MSERRASAVPILAAIVILLVVVLTRPYSSSCVALKHLCGIVPEGRHQERVFKGTPHSS